MSYLLQRNSGLPAILIKGRPAAAVEYDNIIEKQFLLSYAFKGITYEDSNNMTPHELQIGFKVLQDIKDAREREKAN